jgi:flagellar motility protein MotE (MotC chaperone)
LGKKVAIVILTSLFFTCIPFSFAIVTPKITFPEGSIFEPGKNIKIQFNNLNPSNFSFLLIQFTDPLGNIKWVDQLELISTSHTYGFKIPLDWEKGTWIIYVKQDYQESVQKNFVITTQLEPSNNTTDPEKIEKMPLDQAIIIINNLKITEATYLLSNLSIPKAISILEQLNQTKVVSFFKIMSPINAANILNEFYYENVNNILTSLTPKKSAQIMEQMNTTKLSFIIEHYVNDHETLSKYSTFLNLMNENVTSNLLIDFSIEKAASILSGMVNEDSTNTAKLVELMVKNALDNPDQIAQNDTLKRISENFEKMSIEILLELCLEIVKLPETPSTLSHILMFMETSKVLDLISIWSKTENLAELAQVFDYLSEDYLKEIWEKMTQFERDLLYPLLGLDIKTWLPQPGLLVIQNLKTYPEKAEPGEEIIIQADIYNSGDKVEEESFIIFLNNLKIAESNITVVPGDIIKYTWTITRSDRGVYTVRIRNITTYFIIESPPREAEFLFSNLQVIPDIVRSGEQVTAIFNIYNTGEQPGTYKVKVKLNDQIVKTVSDLLQGGESTTATATFKALGNLGSNTVTVENIVAEFTIENSKSISKNNLYIVGGLAGLILFIIIIYDIIAKRKQDELWYKEREELR